MSVRLRVFTVCSGISAASVAWDNDKFEFVGFADISVFSAHWLNQMKGCGRPVYMPAPDDPDLPSPDEKGITGKEAKKRRAAINERRAAIKGVSSIPVAGALPNYGDFTQITDDDLRRLGPVDVLEGGTPCQPWSAAGTRAGFDDRRGNVTLAFIQLAKRMERLNGLKYVVWENVPALIGHPHNPLGCFMAEFSGVPGDQALPPRGGWDACGYVDGPQASVAWRTLNATYFELAQRRSRIFALIVLGAPTDHSVDSFGVLAECGGVRRDSPPRRRAREAGASGPEESAAGDRDRGRVPGRGEANETAGGAGGEAPSEAQRGVAYGIVDHSTVGIDVCPTLQAREKGGGRMEAVAFAVGIGDDPTPKFVDETVPSLRAKREHAVAFPLVGHAEYSASNDCVPPLRAKGGDCGGGSEALIVTTHGAEGADGTLCASGAGLSRAAGQANELDFLIVHSAGFSAGNSEKARGIAYTDEGTPPLRAGPSGTNQVPTVITTVLADAPAPANDADRHEAAARDVLAALRASIGTPAYLHWGACVLAGLRTDAKLAAWMAGGSLRQESEESRSNGDGLDLVDAGHPLRSVWLEGPSGATPEGREMAKQLTLDLGDALASEPEDGADERHLHLLRELAEGARRLRLALAAELAASGRRSRQVKWIVRRLTPVEAERLQGFPDNHTAITINGKPVGDGPRYKAIGNSMATNCMRFIGERLHAAHLESLAEIEASKPKAA